MAKIRLLKSFPCLFCYLSFGRFHVQSQFNSRWFTVILCLKYPIRSLTILCYYISKPVVLQFLALIGNPAICVMSFFLTMIYFPPSLSMVWIHVCSLFMESSLVWNEGVFVSSDSKWMGKSVEVVVYKKSQSVLKFVGRGCFTLQSSKEISSLTVPVGPIEDRDR